MDINTQISIRTQGINKFLSDNISPEDVIFYEKNGQMGITLLPFKGEFPPSYKYEARKQVMNKILKGQLFDKINIADEVIYCSYDDIFNVDYIFSFVSSTHIITLYIVRNGKIIRRYQNFQLEYDERVDLANL